LSLALDRLAARGVEVVAELNPAQLVNTAAAFAKARSPGLTLTLTLPSYTFLPID
jgi:hypothetical protein